MTTTQPESNVMKMGWEDDPAFQPGGPTNDERRRQQEATPSIPYRDMTPDQRREAWNAVREAQTQRAKRSVRTPLLFALSSIALILGGVWAIRHGAASIGAVMLWTSLASAAFAVIAFAKTLVQGLPWEEHDVPPPPGM